MFIVKGGTHVIVPIVHYVWIGRWWNTKYDADDPHVKVEGPKEFVSLKNLNGRDWNNDIQSVIVGSNATVLAYKDKDFKGGEIAFVPGQHS